MLLLTTFVGPGTTTECLRHTFYTLRALLTPSYAVAPITASSLLREPWPPTCALLVIPGGSDHEYCNVLNGIGVSRITSFVRSGGAFLGLCGGGYFASARCEFDMGPGSGPGRHVVGPRELAFFPGTCRGPAFAGFDYFSEVGARASNLALPSFTNGLQQPTLTPQRVIYWNGGGLFVNADSFTSRGVEVLASYADDVDIKLGPDDNKAAIIYCKVGNGSAVLTGPHPE